MQCILQKLEQGQQEWEKLGMPLKTHVWNIPEVNR